MILVDSETKVDLLNNEAIAKTIAAMLREQPDKPVTLGVHGDWGAGKSSVLEMIEATLESEDKILCIKFNGWRFQGFEDAKIALIEGVVTSLAANRTLSAKAKGAVTGLLKRIDYMKLAKRGGGLAWNLTTGMPSPDQIETAVTTLGHMASNPADYVTKEKIEDTAKNLGGALKPAKARRMPQEVEEFRKDFGKLLKEAKIDQLVVLIDDLDRCLPPTVIETLEAVRLFVFTENTAFIVGADEAMIEYAVRRHFPELPGSGAQDYARNYLEKLIQIPFRIPALGETETRIYVALLLIGAVVGEDDGGFKKLIEEARERLKRPWLSRPLDAQAVKAALGDRADVQDMLTLSDQIGPILAAGTRGNPRQIKRFLNALLLRKSIAEARGFGDEVELPKLGKLMLVERFMPQYFIEIAESVATSTTGVSKEVEHLEGGTAVGGDNKVLEGWLESTMMKDWAALEPKLRGIDLRPYLFVSKDKKDYFGSSAALGNLLTIVEGLLGPKITISGMKADLAALAPPEAAQVFEELRTRIMGNGDLKKRPAGADGVAALVGVHPVLEANLLDLLEALPVDRIGTWVVGGWQFKEALNQNRYNLSLARWSQVTGNAALKAAATAATATTRPRS